MNKLVATLVSIYIAMFLYRELPFIKTIGPAGLSAVGVLVSHLIVFVVIFILLEILVSRHISTSAGAGFGGSLKTLGLSVGILGLVIIVLYHFIPIGTIYNFPSIIDTLFASDIAFLCWLVAPLLLLFF
jgi:hypothetical protein